MQYVITATGVEAIDTRATIESPDVPLTSDNIIRYLGGSNGSQSGVNVTRQTALGYPPLWRGINLIAKDVGNLPVDVYRRGGAGGRERDVNHAANRVLKRNPAPNVTCSQFKTTLTAHALLEGNGYARIHRDAAARPIRLEILNPAQTSLVRNTKTGRFWYLNYTAAGSERRYNPENVIHIRGLSFDGLTGYSALDLLKDSLGLGIAAQRYGSTFFKNNAQPGVIIQVPYRIRDEEMAAAIKKRWTEKHGGLENAHEPAVTDEGTKVVPLGGTNETAQFIQTREFELRMVAAILGIPPHKLGDNTRTSYGSLEQENQAYLSEALKPWLTGWQEELGEKLLTEDEKDMQTHFVEFNVRDLVRVDQKSRFESYNIGIMGGFMKRSEARSAENLPADDAVDTFLQPLNMVEVGQQQVDEGGAGDDGRDERVETAVVHPSGDRSAIAIDAVRDSAEMEARRMIGRLRAKAIKASRKADVFCEWIDRGLSEEMRVACDMLRPSVRIHDRLLYGSTSNRTAELINDFAESIRAELTEIADTVTIEELRGHVESMFVSHLEHGPRILADRVVARSA